MNDLILNVDALEQANQPFEAELPREYLEALLRADPPTEFHAAGASKVRGQATKLGRKVFVRARFEVPLSGQCKRCLKPLSVGETVELTRTYVPAAELQPRPHGWEDKPHRGRKPREDRDEEGSAATFDPETIDEEAYAGKEIDLSAAVREQVLLSVPPSPLCSEACPGLCPSCGKDLNEGDCGCDRTALDPRWAALKSIQLDKKET